MNKKSNIISKNTTIAKEINNSELRKFLEEKTLYIQEIIRNTSSSIKKNTQLEIFSNTDANISITVLNELYSKSNKILKLDF